MEETTDRWSLADKGSKIKASLRPPRMLFQLCLLSWRLSHPGLRVASLISVRADSVMDFASIPSCPGSRPGQKSSLNRDT